LNVAGTGGACMHGCWWRSQTHLQLACMEPWCSFFFHDSFLTYVIRNLKLQTATVIYSDASCLMLDLQFIVDIVMSVAREGPVPYCTVPTYCTRCIAVYSSRPHSCKFCRAK
jgi:hypothetical protein